MGISRSIVAARSWAAAARPHGRGGPDMETQDRFLTDGVVFGVADGASRPAHGDIAAAMALAEFARCFSALRDEQTDVSARVHAAAASADDTVRRQAGGSSFQGMMTTLSVFAVWDGYVAAASIGDSRIVLLRNGTVVQLMYEALHGAAKTFIGGPSQVRISTEVFAARDGDRLVVLTDGFDALSLETIQELAEIGNTQQAVDRLAAAVGEPADDDHACVVIALGVFPYVTD